MANVQVEEVTREDAARVMRAAGLRVALDLETPEDLAANGACFTLRTERGEGVFVLSRAGDVLWVDGAGAVSGQGLTEDGFQAFERIARGQGCNAIGFQTTRPGLVRRAERAGFRVAGFIMEKAVPNGR